MNNPNPSLRQVIDQVIALVREPELKTALTNALDQSEESIAKIEGLFARLPEARWSDEFMATFFHSWKATHLKMLGIYGLSCRLQRMGMELDGEARTQLLLAGALNAETSYEDLGLDFQGETHAALYNQMAGAFLNDDSWSLGRHLMKEASEFRDWIYNNMVVEDDVTVGLFTNMFSEIYNHGEYSIALPAFHKMIEKHYGFDAEKTKETCTYIEAHIEDDTEMDHFFVVIESMEAYGKATDNKIDYAGAEKLFAEYLHRLGNVMSLLTGKMEEELVPA